MQRAILRTLRGIESAQGVRILYAAESGSRAWDFASPDSDYDVRFVYVRPAEDYLRLSAPREVIGHPPEGALDASGWDLQKALRLLEKSNPTLFEWDNSPIVYRTTGAWQAFAGIMGSHFRPKAGLWHYLSTAQSNYRAYLKGETVRLKKYLYVLRPLLACRWILQEGTPPPMRFAQLVEAQLDAPLRPAVQRLLSDKARGPELGEGARIGELNAYVEEQLSALRPRIGRLPEGAKERSGELDRLFLSIVTAGAI